MVSRTNLLPRSGALVSTAGVTMFVVFVAVLLAFPVLQSCPQNASCTYKSMAPDSLQPIVKPGFLALSLAIIAAGIFLIRFSSWRKSKKNGTRD